jgi:hypothetical protein
METLPGPIRPRLRAAVPRSGADREREARDESQQ